MNADTSLWVCSPETRRMALGPWIAAEPFQILLWLGCVLKMCILGAVHDLLSLLACILGARFLPLEPVFRNKKHIILIISSSVLKSHTPQKHEPPPPKEKNTKGVKNLV